MNRLIYIYIDVCMYTYIQKYIYNIRTLYIYIYINIMVSKHGQFSHFFLGPGPSNRPYMPHPCGWRNSSPPRCAKSVGAFGRTGQMCVESYIDRNEVQVYKTKYRYTYTLYIHSIQYVYIYMYTYIYIYIHDTYTHIYIYTVNSYNTIK